MTPSLAMGLMDIACAVIFILVSLPLVYNKIPMNRWYGFRIRKSFRSDEDWYAINAYGGKQMIIWTPLLFISGILKLYMSMEVLKGPWGLAIVCGPLLAYTVLSVTISLIYAISR